MIDALGSVQSVLVLGGSSDIAVATVEAVATPHLRRVVLAGRPSPALDAAAERLRAATAAEVTTTAFDAAMVDSHAAVVDAVFDAGDIDVVLLAFGVLGVQETLESDSAAAVEVATVNYVGGVSAALLVAARLRAQGHGVLVVLSSVAGERARRSNFVYGSTKAGLDALAMGLGDSLVGSGARVLVVRPGFVRTRMTAGLPEAPLSVDASDVAAAIATGLRRGSEVVYAPPTMRYVMSALRHLPRPVFRRLPI